MNAGFRVDPETFSYVSSRREVLEQGANPAQPCMATARKGIKRRPHAPASMAAGRPEDEREAVQAGRFASALDRTAGGHGRETRHYASNIAPRVPRDGALCKPLCNAVRPFLLTGCGRDSSADWMRVRWQA